MNADLAVAVISAVAGLVGVLVGSVLPVVLTQRNERLAKRDSVRRAMRLVESDLFQAQKRLESAAADEVWSKDSLPSVPPSWVAQKDLIAGVLPPELFLDVDTVCIEIEHERLGAMRLLGDTGLSPPLGEEEKARLVTLIPQVGGVRHRLNHFVPGDRGQRVKSEGL